MSRGEKDQIRHWLHEEKAGAVAEAADRYIRYEGEPHD